MDTWQRSHIESNLPDLIRDTICTAEFLAYFIRHQVFSQADVEIIMSQKAKSDKNSKLFDLLITRNGAYEVLVRGLYETSQTGHLETLLKGYLLNGVFNPIKKCGLRITSSLTKEVRSIAVNEVIETTINYQGSSNTISQHLQGMCEKCKNQTLAHLDLNSINNIIGEGPNYLLLNDTIGLSNGLYQRRTLTSLRYRLDELAFQKNRENLFLFKGIEHNELSQLVNPSNTVLSKYFYNNPQANLVLLEHVDHLKDIWKKESRNIFLLNYTDRKFYLETTKGSNDSIKVYMKSDPVDISEMELIDFIIRVPNIICIETQQGMGNTEFLKSIARQLSKQQNVYVGCLDFLFLLKTFRNGKLNFGEHNLVDILVENNSNTFANNSFQRMFLKQKLNCSKTQKYVCIDNFDKIQNKDFKHAETILKILQCSTDDNLKIVITAPAHLTPLVEPLLGKLHFILKPWILVDQQQFFSSYFELKKFSKHDANICSKRLLQLLNYQLTFQGHDLAALPSHCHTLAEVTSQRIDEGNHSHFIKRNCKDVVFKCVESILKKSFDKMLADKESKFFCIQKIFTCHCQQPDIKEQVGLFAYDNLVSTEADKDRIALENSNQVQTPSHTQTTMKAHINLLVLAGFYRTDNESGCIQNTIFAFLAARYLFDGIITKWRFSSCNTTLKLIFTILSSFEVVTNVVLQDMPQEEEISVNQFSNCSIVYFLNYFLAKRPLCEDEKKFLLTCCGGIEMEAKIFQDILFACIYLDFRAIFDLCIFLFQHRVELPKNTISLHESKYFCLAAKYASTESFKHYWKTLETLGFSGKYNHRIDGFITPIHISVHYGNYELFEELRNVYGKDTIESMHLLHSCIIGSVSRTNQEIINQRVQMVKLLVNENRKLLEKDITQDKNRTALLQPHTHIELLECLIELGANVNDLTYSDNSVLHQALLNDNFSQILSLSDFKKLFNLVREKGFVHFDKPNSLGETPIQLLIRRMEVDKELVKKFSDQKVDLERNTRKGENLLLLAMRKKRSLDTLKILLNFDINYTAVDNNQRTLLHYSVLAGNVDIVEHVLGLLEIEVNAKDVNGDTAMHLAARLNSNQAEPIQNVLIKNGAGLSIKNDKGFVPILDGFRLSSKLTVSLNTIKLIESLGFLITSDLANECMQAILLNRNLSYSCVISHELLLIFKFMIEKLQIDITENLKTNALTFKDFEICLRFLENRSVSSFLRFRQVHLAKFSETVLFTNIPKGIEEILDKENKTLIYFTANTRILSQRLCDCLGGNILVYPNCKNFPLIMSKKKTSVDVLLVNVGSDPDIFSLHSEFICTSKKIIYITALGTKCNLPNEIPRFNETICWNDLTTFHQQKHLNKWNKSLGRKVLEFSENDFVSLSLGHIVSLVYKQHVPLDVICHLASNKYHDLLQNQEIAQLLYSEIAKDTIDNFFEKILNDLYSSNLLEPLGSPSNGMTTNLLPNEIVVDDCVYGYSSLTTLQRFLCLGFALAKNLFENSVRSLDTKELYDRCFKIEEKRVYILNLDGSIRDGPKQTLICFQFTYAALVYFYDRYFESPSIFLRVAGVLPRQFLSACIRANLGKLLNAVCEVKEGWFLNEELVFIAICSANVSTIKIVVECFEKASKTMVSSITLKNNKNITPLHAALQRGNYEVVDYVLNTLGYKSKLGTMTPTSLIRYCLSYTTNLKQDRIEPRKAILELVVSQFQQELQRKTKSLRNIWKNVLVESINIHIDLLKFLIECGANVWDVDGNKSTVAHLSPKYLTSDEYLELVKFIINRGDGQLFKSRNLNEESALRCALKYLEPGARNEERICEILEVLHTDAGIKFDLPNKLHITILQCAIQKNHSPKVLQKIVEINKLYERGKK